MTGVSELRRIRVASAAPDHIRVSVFGGRTQLDIALPLDVPVSGFVPELARLVRSRDSERDGEATSKDERRTFWVLSRFDDGTALRPDQTLREAGVRSGELLRLSSQRALSPPILYDDVVDAVGRLNKAAYAAWNAASARWMAFAGVHLAALAIVYCLLGRGSLANHAGHYVIVALAAAVVLMLTGGAGLAHRSYGLDDVAAALGWAAVPITAGIAWAVLARYGYFGLAAACATVLVLCAVYDRVIGTGHWAYLAGALAFGLIGIAMLGRALHGRADIVFVTSAVATILICLTVPRLTVRLGRFETPTVAVATNREDWDFENPFQPPASTNDRDGDSGTAMPTAEAVWARAKSAAVTRAALLTGLASGVAVDVTLLLGSGVLHWPAFVFALACAAVLALRSRTVDTWFERAALAVPAAAIVVVGCVMAQGGITPMPVTGLGMLLAVAVGTALAGLTGAGGGLSPRLAALLAYAEYAAVGSLIPLALWVIGVYQRLGL
ncbi:type VII secretion integral membrane protein EccD [Mycobacterium sp. 852002-51163_SCH5372311]|uniref:type VII secretion integral membrane protein EccD n=1 Tax=Mycobacterium sp. 852002-51163_SCH5372311 TaxID=1834097 RepID=UPI000800FE99|nr:type VII secretion integral membrane protein EccD [Mycobacterium sp. 852002-51163_SCH5372311]OBF86673.1 type VII secretion integral membrane protein EccD [Mycobacterium sp. 852002-51163_SCH5372311]